MLQSIEEKKYENNRGLSFFFCQRTNLHQRTSISFSYCQLFDFCDIKWAKPICFMRLTCISLLFIIARCYVSPLAIMNKILHICDVKGVDQ